MLLPVRRAHAAPPCPASHLRASSSLGLRSRQVDRALRGSTVARASPAAMDAAAIAHGRRAVVGMALAVSLSVPAYCRAPPPSASARTEDNLLFLEAWRAVDHAYYDKSFNGQSWFRYREPMNTREETFLALMCDSGCQHYRLQNLYVVISFSVSSSWESVWKKETTGHEENYSDCSLKHIKQPLHSPGR